MHPTKNDLSKKIRASVIDLLQERLADSIDLSLQVKQAHWNVRGPNFIALHELFDEVYETVEEAMDDIAERLIQLGGSADGTVKSVAKRTGLKDYPLKITSGKDHVEALSDALAAFGKAVRAAIDTSDKLGDKGTADLFTGVSRGIDKKLWMVEAHGH